MDGDRQPRLQVNARIAGLHGWGMAAPPTYPVRLELRDPGFLVVVRPRTLRTEDLLKFHITRIDLRLGARQYSRGGNFSGGGYGITGALTGMAIAGALNKASYARWEETHLTIIETMPVGTTRSVTFSFAVDTPTSLMERLDPALHALVRRLG